MNDPFKITEPTVISFSGGRTSAYLLWRVLQSNNGLPKDAVVCFANTGKEHESTLEFVNDCSVNWNVPIVWLEYNKSNENGFDVVNFESCSRNGEPFERLINDKGILPNVFMRFCTQELKVTIIRKYCKSINLDVDDRSHLVGIRADEPRRIAKVGLDMCPLAQENISENDISNFWENNSFDLKLPKVKFNVLSNCDLCFLKGDKTLSSIIKDDPKKAVWWIKMEEEQQKKIDDNKKNGIATFRKGSISYKKMMEFSEDQIDMFSDESISCFCGD
jgi:3'-phosphoadenosine 5'-phosphosulfate sulfotransferase (PAPS reductase)/FAD synthetase